jgi:hypothetical protein
MGWRSKNEATVRIGPKIVMCKCFVSEITESPRDGSQKILNAHCLPAKECIFESTKKFSIENMKNKDCLL